jgi:formylglycine-generating enzyme required for sulfatase activity
VTGITKVRSDGYPQKKEAMMRAMIGMLVFGLSVIVGCGSQPPAKAPEPAPAKTTPSSSTKASSLPAFELQPKWASATGRDQYGFWADLKVDNVLQRMRFISSGTFQMGSPETEPSSGKDEVLHTVTLTQGFWLGDSEVTQNLWKCVMGENPANAIQDPTCPVDSVSWLDSQKFFQKLNLLKGGLYASLPTESQWEYACRSGTTAMFSGEPTSVSWSFKRRSFPVKMKPANAWGLHDMHGNVWEWCEDWYGPYPMGPVSDPIGATTGTLRVLRGGSWSDGYAFARSARRMKQVPSTKGQNAGLRISIPATRKDR